MGKPTKKPELKDFFSFRRLIDKGYGLMFLLILLYETLFFAVGTLIRGSLDLHSIVVLLGICAVVIAIFFLLALSQGREPGFAEFAIGIIMAVIPFSLGLVPGLFAILGSMDPPPAYVHVIWGMFALVVFDFFFTELVDTANLGYENTMLEGLISHSHKNIYQIRLFTEENRDGREYPLINAVTIYNSGQYSIHLDEMDHETLLCETCGAEIREPARVDYLLTSKYVVKDPDKKFLCLDCDLGRTPKP